MIIIIITVIMTDPHRDHVRAGDQLGGQAGLGPIAGPGQALRGLEGPKKIRNKHIVSHDSRLLQRRSLILAQEELGTDVGMLTY